MKRLLIAALVFAWPALGLAQQSTISPSVNASVSITTGNTFQTVLSAVPDAVGTPRKSLTIQNNNTGDSCWIFLGSGTASKAKSILLTTGGSYSRYFPYVPADVIQATCTTTADTLYVDYQ